MLPLECKTDTERLKFQEIRHFLDTFLKKNIPWTFALFQETHEWRILIINYDLTMTPHRTRANRLSITKVLVMRPFLVSLHLFIITG